MQKLLGFYRKQMSTYSRCQTLYNRSTCTESISSINLSVWHAFSRSEPQWYFWP